MSIARHPRDPSTPPRVSTSSVREARDRASCLAAGIYDHVVKPVRVDTLVMTSETALR